MVVERTVRVSLVGDSTALVQAANQARTALNQLGNTNLGNLRSGIAGAGNAAGTASNQTDGFGQSIKNALSLVGIQAGFEGIKSGFDAIIQQGLDYQANMNTLAAVTGASNKQMADLGERARQLGADVTIPGANAAIAAESMMELAKGGLNVSQTMSAARGTLLLAAAAQVSGAEAAQIQAKALNAFRLGADQAGHVADVLANGANAATGEVTDMAMALQQTATVAAGFNINIDDTSTALALFAKNGLVGSDGGTSFKTMLQQLASPTVAQRSAMEDLNLEVYDAQGNFLGMREITKQLSSAYGRLSTEQYNTAASTLFGTDAIRSANILGREGTKGWDDMADKVTEAGGAAELAAAQQLGLNGALDRLGNTVSTVSTDFFKESLQPAMIAIVDVATVLAQGIGTLIGWFGDLPAPIQAAVLAIGGLILLSGPVSKLWTSFMATGVGTAITGQMAIARTAMQAARTDAVMAGASFNAMAARMRIAGAAAVRLGNSLKAAFLSNPWGVALVVLTTAVTGLIGSFQDAQPAVEDFSDIIDESTGKLKVDAAQLTAHKQTVIEASDAYRSGGGAVGDWTKALLGDGEALDRVQTQLHRHTAEVLESEGVWASYKKAHAGTKLTLDEFTTGILNQSIELDSQKPKVLEAVQNQKDFADQQRAIAKDTNDAVGALEEGTEATDKYRTGAQVGAEAVAQLAEKTKAAVEQAQFLAENDQLSVRLADFKDKTDAAKRSLELFNEILDEADGRNRAYDDVLASNAAKMDDFRKAFEDGTKAATENTEAGNLNTQALTDWDFAALIATDGGRELYGSLNDLAEGHMEVVNGAYQNALATGTVEEAQQAAMAKANENRQAFIDLAAQYLDGNVPAATAIADKLGFLDGQTIADKGFAVLAEDQDAQADLKAAQDAQITEKRFAITAEAQDAMNTVTLLNAQLDTLDGRKIQYTVVGSAVVATDEQALQDQYNKELSRGYHNGVAWDQGGREQYLAAYRQAHADGGWVTGPGGPKDDKVKIRASPGEFIIRAAQARKHAGLVEAINDGTMGFADGGAVPAPDGAATGAAATVAATLTGSIATPDVEAFSAAWEAIAAAVSDAWLSIIAPTLDLLTAGSVDVGQAQADLLNVQVVPSWTAIGATVVGTWGGVVAPTYEQINAGTVNVGNTILLTWAGTIAPTYAQLNAGTVDVGVHYANLLNGTVIPVWSSIGATVAGTWGGTVSPTYDQMNRGAGNLGGAMNNLAGTTASAWSSIGASISGAYTGQIVPAWNGVQGFATATGGFFGGIQSGMSTAKDQITSDLGEITTAIDEFFAMVDGKAPAGSGSAASVTITGGNAAMADGGLITMGTGPRSDDVHIRASKGEYVVNAKSTARHKDTLDAINYGGAYADGGLIGDKISTDVNQMVIDGAQRAIEGIVVNTLAKFPSTAGGFISNGNWGPAVLGGFAENTAAAKAYIESHFSGVSSIGGLYGGSVEGSDHPFGKALDVMIADYASQGGIAAGTTIADWFINNPSAFGTKYVIWRDRINQGGVWSPYSHPSGNNDTLAHRDHVHLSFLTGTGAFAGQSVAPPVGEDDPAKGWLASILGKIKMGGTAAPAAFAYTGTGGGGVEQWRSTVLQALALLGQPASFADITLMQMDSESSGNVRAINLSDSNAAKGTPSKSLMQVIDPTFNAMQRYSPIPLTDIWDPLQNIVAGMLWQITNTGSLANWSGHAYDNGGMLTPGWNFNGLGTPEPVLTDRQWGIASAAMNHVIQYAPAASEGHTITVNNYLDGTQIDSRTEYIVDGRLIEVARAMATSGAQR